MRVLVDAVHAADVWTLGAVEDRLLADGASTLWMSRLGKEAVVPLIEARGRPHVATSIAGSTTAGLLKELLIRDWRSWQVARRFRPDLILTRSPSGAHMGRITHTPVLYDTDDGRAAGALYWAGAPFANLVTSPTATFPNDSRRHRRYRAYKELFYLHPDRFEPDPGVREELRLQVDEPLFVLRLTAFTASHDRGESGLTRGQVRRLVSLFSGLGRLVVSSERELPPDLAVLGNPLRPERFHHLLAAADLVVGDGQSACSEAAVLGTPSIRLSTWAHRHAYQVELEQRWGLTKAFLPDRESQFFAEVDRVVGDLADAAARHDQARDRMLEWCDDPVDDVVRWIHELV